MKTVLITGIAGFAGSFLAEHLLSQGDVKIVGTTLSLRESPNLAAIQNKITLKEINLFDSKGVSEIVAQEKPDQIFHLAALASPTASFQNPSETITNNIAAEVNILEGIKNSNLLHTRVLIVSSAEVYGLIKEEDLPMDENTALNPTSPYAVSKIAQDFLALQYFISNKIQGIRVRPFNHIGPRQTPQFVVARFASQIAEIEKGKKEPKLLVGSLDAKRDFTDVRDMVRAYSMILEKGIAGDVYNIGSDQSHKIADMLDMLLSLSKVKITVEKDPGFARTADNPHLLCDSSKMRKVTGWKPEIPFEQTLKDTLDYWRNIV